MTTPTRIATSADAAPSTFARSKSSSAPPRRRTNAGRPASAAGLQTHRHKHLLSGEGATTMQEPLTSPPAEPTGQIWPDLTPQDAVANAAASSSWRTGPGSRCAGRSRRRRATLHHGPRPPPSPPGRPHENRRNHAQNRGGRMPRHRHPPPARALPGGDPAAAGRGWRRPNPRWVSGERERFRGREFGPLL